MGETQLWVRLLFSPRCAEGGQGGGGGWANKRLGDKKEVVAAAAARRRRRRRRPVRRLCPAPCPRPDRARLSPPRRAQRLSPGVPAPPLLRPQPCCMLSSLSPPSLSSLPLSSPPSTPPPARTALRRSAAITIPSSLCLP